MQSKQSVNAEPAAQERILNVDDLEVLPQRRAIVTVAGTKPPLVRKNLWDTPSADDVRHSLAECEDQSVSLEQQKRKTMNVMFVERAHIPDDSFPNPTTWPLSVPAVAALVGEGLAFTSPVTFIVGDNGSGKSTIVEALAEQFGLHAEGGRASVPGGNIGVRKTDLGETLRLTLTPHGERMRRAPRLSRNGFFLRAETAYNLQAKFSGWPGYWSEDTTQLSHGEGFVSMFRAMLTGGGFYVLDEPEAPLSFTACLQLVGLIHEIGQSGGQVICATHSPILAATPGADIFELGDHGVRRAEWQSLALVDHWRRYLTDPAKYLRHIID